MDGRALRGIATSWGSRERETNKKAETGEFGVLKLKDNVQTPKKCAGWKLGKSLR